MIRTSKKKWRFRFSVGLLLFALSGCLGTSPPVSFYTLTPMVGRTLPDAFSNFPKDLVVGIGPIEIPELYNRPQIVTKTGENRVALSEYHRWAGSLQEEITDVLTENLSLLLQSEHIVPFPWDGIPEPGIKIAVKVHRFDGVFGKSTVFSATWSIRDLPNRKTPLIKKTFLETPVDEIDYQNYVSAKSRLLAAFSRELALEIMKSQLK